jgi:predicted O-methyltransferase YrrM
LTRAEQTDANAAWPRPRLTGRLSGRSPARGLFYNAVFAKALPLVAARRVRRSDHPDAQALARAIDAIRGRGIAASEADWIERIERRRSRFAAQSTVIQLGERPSPAGPRERSPRYLARVSSIHRPWGTFLLRLVRELRPRSCLELGTAIGISAAYQGSALELNGSGSLHTVEGTARLVELARGTLDDLGIGRVVAVQGRFDQVLDRVLADAGPIEFAFLDAGKTREQVLPQFEQILPNLAPGAAVVFDDVHWSREAKRAWEEVRRHPRVGLSVDLWRLGACLMHAE